MYITNARFDNYTPILPGKLLTKLDLPVLTEFWLRKATSMIPESEKRKDLESASLFQQVRVNRIYGPLTSEYPIRVTFTEYGRAVVATENLEPGRAIIIIIIIKSIPFLKLFV